MAAVQGDRHPGAHDLGGKEGRAVQAGDAARPGTVRPIVDEKYLVPKTVEFIKRNAAAKKPFFVYVRLLRGAPAGDRRTRISPTSPRAQRTFADIIAEMDYRVGQILDAVKEAGIDDNTIVILSSDNGGGGALPQLGPGSNGPWRGNFFNTPFEGSMRVPAMIRWPGKVPAGVVTEEMLAAVDWLPTLAGMVGASKLVPKDRPIDGVDASAFMLGKSDTTGRDSYMFFGPDGELMSVKWKQLQGGLPLYTGYCPAINGGYISRRFRCASTSSSDPHEDFNLLWTDLTNGWMLAPAFMAHAEYEKSVKEYPNIGVGEEFEGYK